MQGGGKQTLQVHCSWKTEGPMIAKSGQRGKVTVNWFSQTVTMGTGKSVIVFTFCQLSSELRIVRQSSLLRSSPLSTEKG